MRVLLFVPMVAVASAAPSPELLVFTAGGAREANQAMRPVGQDSEAEGM